MLWHTLKRWFKPAPTLMPGDIEALEKAATKRQLKKAQRAYKNGLSGNPSINTGANKTA